MSNLNSQIHAIIPAAGSGQRMRQSGSGSLAKQYLTVCGQTIIEHSLSAFLDNDIINSVVVCLAAKDEQWPNLDCAKNPKVKSTLGGETRAQSVLNGLLALEEVADHNDWVLVHDAARPNFSQQLLNHLVSDISDDAVGGILAVQAKDTLKMADVQNRVEQTLDRSNVWQAQTPQMFRYGLLKNAIDHALESSLTITDEASAIEFAGHSVKLVQGDARNIKVTTADDLALAEFLLSKQ